MFAHVPATDHCAFVRRLVYSSRDRPSNPSSTTLAPAPPPIQSALNRGDVLQEDFPDSSPFSGGVFTKLVKWQRP